MKKRSGKSSVVIFTCSWYPAIAADNAGVLGKEYPFETRIVTLSCAGMLTPSLILDSFGAGAQGVLVAACKPEVCHYTNGSSTCEKVVAEAAELGALLGIEEERMRFAAFDSEDAEAFVSCVKEFSDGVGKLGPLSAE
ncbi:MAG: hydrogenase iron-sulfur subunit [Candidatus Eisenbacteria bacterium]